MTEITEEQRQEAQKYLDTIKQRQLDQIESQQILGKCEKEAEALIKFLEKKELKKFKSILVEEGMLPNGTKQERSFAIEYVRGVDLHFLVLKHAAEVLKICKTIST